MENRFETFTILISKIARAIRKIKSEEMKEFNLQGPHVSCLFYLYKSDKPLTAKELCDMCDEDKAAISRSIEYLEKEGFIDCQSKTEKRYKSPLSLTQKGEESAKKIAVIIDNIVAVAGEGLNEDNRKIFYESLSLISKNLENMYNNYGE